MHCGLSCVPQNSPVEVLEPFQWCMDMGLVAGN